MGKNFLKNSSCIVPQEVIEHALREFSQILARSFNEQGKSLSQAMSFICRPSTMVPTISSNSLMCRYGLLFSIPWNVGSNGNMHCQAL